MKLIKIRHTAPVWEETLFEVEVTDDQAADLLGDDPDYEFRDVLINQAVMNGTATIQVTTGIDSMDADFEVTEVEYTPPYTQEQFDEAVVFLTSLVGKAPKEISAMITAFLTDVGIKTPRSYSKLNVLITACRTIRAAPGMSKVMDALKTSLIENE